MKPPSSEKGWLLRTYFFKPPQIKDLYSAAVKLNKTVAFEFGKKTDNRFRCRPNYVCQLLAGKRYTQIFLLIKAKILYQVEQYLCHPFTYRLLRYVSYIRIGLCQLVTCKLDNFKCKRGICFDKLYQQLLSLIH